MLEIAKSDILSRLQFDNRWWTDVTKVPFKTAPRRLYFPIFFKRVEDASIRRAVVLMGPRRVGKTVMVYQAVSELLANGVPAERILYLSLETPIYTGLSLERLVEFFCEIHGHTRDDNLYIFFDEVQYLRDWEVHLKSLVDSFPSFRFVATGSAAAALRLKSNESGAGRFSDFILPPLTFAEYLMFIKRDDLVEVEENSETPSGYFSTKEIDEVNKEFVNYLNYGGYPEAVLSEAVREDPAQYIKSDIIDKVLLRDLPSLYGISDIQELNRLFTTLAYNSGREVSLEGLATSSGVAKNTIRRYIEYLEAAFLIQRIERIDNNAKRFKRAMCFKVYLNNPSMRAALFGQVSMDSDAMGALTETAIFSQWQHNLAASLYYARWNSGEVDVVYMAGSELKPAWAVEIKWSDRPTTDYKLLDNCVEFGKRHNLLARFLVTTKTVTQQAVTYKGISFYFLPSALYAYTLGANILNNINKNMESDNLVE